MEARELPAAYWWSPTVSEYSTDRVNWMKGPGSPYARYTIYDNLPAAGDDLHFSGDLSSADCVLPPYGGSPPAPLPPPPPYSPPSPPPPPPPSPPPPVHAGDVFNSIRLEDGYTGSVVLARDLQVNILEVGSGYIAQNYAYDLTASGNTHAGDFTVSGTFAWTGGGIQYGPRAPTYNDEIVPGIFNLAATATGLAAPTDAGTVYLGSTLELQGIPEDPPTPSLGSTLTMTDGTYNLNGGSFHALDGSQLIMAPIPKANKQGTPDIFVKDEKWTKPVVTVDAGATAKVTSVGRVNNVVPVEVRIKGSDPDDPGVGVEFNNNGTVVIDSYTQLIVEKQPNANFAAYLQIKTPNKPAPITYLQAGSEIIFKHNGNPATGCMEIKDGTLRIDGLNGVTDPAKQVAVIKNEAANPTVPALFIGYGAKVTVGPLSPFVKLAITGDLKSDGDIVLRADRTAANDDIAAANNDRIETTGSMSFGIGQIGQPDPAKLKVSWTNPAGALPGADAEWKLLVITGTGGFINDPVAEIPTDVQLPSTLTAGRLTNVKQYGMKFKK